MKRKIKVLHVLRSLSGVDIYLRLLIENSNSDLVEHVVIHCSPNKEYYDIKGNKTTSYIIPIKREINIIYDLWCIFQTIKIIKKEKPSVIHTHSAKGGLIGRLAGVFFKMNVLHTPHAYSYLSAKSKIKRRVFLNIERVLKKLNSILVATSVSELERGIDEVGYNPDRAVNFNNSIKPINVNHLTSFDEFSIPKGFICTIGRPSYQKNIEMMVEVIKNIKPIKPDIHLVVMGLGVVSPNTEKVKSLISKFNLVNNFTLIDWMPREKALSVLEKSDFYISTSRYEGLPYAIIESLALSKAIIATDCDGNRDLVENNFNGYLVKQGDVYSFKDKVLELYKNLETRKNFETNSYELFNKKFNIDNNISILVNIYQKYGSENYY